MRVLEDMKEQLEDQLKKITKKGDAISPQELDNAYKAIDIIKDITTIEAMQKAEKEQEDMKKEMEGHSQGRGMSMGYSQHWPHPIYYSMDASNAYAGNYAGNYAYDGGSYARDGRSYDGNPGGSYAQGGNSGANMGNSGDYSEDYSGRRGRGADGRYVSRDGGSYRYSGAEDPEKEQMKQQLKQMEHKLNQM